MADMNNEATRTEGEAMRTPTREDHCTHPDAVRCDCDWCRVIADVERRLPGAVRRAQELYEVWPGMLHTVTYPSPVDPQYLD